MKANGGKVTAKELAAKRSSQNGLCAYCRMPHDPQELTIDHVIPVARGGADDESNVVTTSMLRNSAKSNWLLDEVGWPRCLVVGVSFGGMVAFEMAQQLTRAGESVPLVAMLDTRSPGERRPADLDPCIRLAGMARGEALAAGKEISLTADDLRPLDADARIVRALEVLRAAGVVPDDVEVGWRAAFLRGLEVRMASALRYEATLYPGRIAMFVPSERIAGPEFRPLQDVPGWEAYASEPLVKQTVPGNHNNMVLGENAAVLAGHLREVIEESLLTADVG